MSKVRVHNFVVSLDGFATGEAQSREAPFGHAQERIEKWFEAAHVWRRDVGSLGAGGGLDESIAADWERGIGAEIMGRNKFGPQRGPWADETWRGWWGSGRARISRRRRRPRRGRAGRCR